MADPKKGTGKKPKGSGRRLYTDENPKDTVRIKFATPTDARKTVAKVKRIKKPFARKIQILTVGEQRAKVMGKTQVANIFKKGKMSIRRTRKKRQNYVLEVKQRQKENLRCTLAPMQMLMRLKSVQVKLKTQAA